MRDAPSVPQRIVDVSWRLRRRLGPRSRSEVRRIVDPAFGPVLGSVGRVVTTRPEVALTIDDGPDARWTPRILDVLARHGVHATFFMLVDRAESRPDLVRRVVAEGHDIGLHGVDHTAFTDLGHHIDDVLADGRDRLETLTGSTIHWLRPPFGSQSLQSFHAARRAGLDVVVWGVDGADWENPEPSGIAQRIATTARAGDIVLLHDGLCPEPQPGQPVSSLDRAEAIDRTITELAAVGLECRALAELIRTGRPYRTVWFRPSPSQHQG